MEYKIDDLVTRASYNHDVIFKIIDIVDNIAVLKGINIRLCADSDISDLVKYEKRDNEIIEDDSYFVENAQEFLKLDREEYFYLPGRILHIDGDKEYLERCLKFYQKSEVLVYGVHISEEDMPIKIKKYLEDVNPDILVITGHDAYYRKNRINDVEKPYKNTESFLNTVIEARKYEKAHDKLIIIAGACQSNYEDLIKAGANFASSPKRVNIHALDPAIIALAVSLSDKNNDIDLIGILRKTKYGSDGMGGVITKGTMYVGYPR